MSKVGRGVDQCQPISPQPPGAPFSTVGGRISRVSLNILRQSVPDTEIETIRDVRPVSRHPGFRVGGTPVAEGSSKIRLQDMTMPFDLEITLRSGHDRHRLRTTFTIDCRKIDETPENEYRLEIHEQIGLL